MEWYALPALVALLLKLWLLVHARHRSWLGGAWIGFVAVFAVHNAVELTVLLKPSGLVNFDLLIRTYYVCTALVLVYGLHYVTDRSEATQRYLVSVFSAIVTLLSVGLMASNMIVSGVTDLVHSLQADRGAAFGVFPAFVIATLTALVAVLRINYVRYSNTHPAKQAELRLAAIALTPLLLVTMIVSALLDTEYRINAAVLVPMASTLFLMITFKGRVVVRDDLRRQAIRQSSADLDEMTSDQQLTFIRHALKYQFELDTDMLRESLVASAKLSRASRLRRLFSVRAWHDSANDG